VQLGERERKGEVATQEKREHQNSQQYHGELLPKVPMP